MFKKKLTSFFMITVSFVLVANVFAGQSEDKIWREISDENLKNRPQPRVLVPESYKTFKINKVLLNEVLDKAPMEFSQAAKIQEIVLSLPMPDGMFSRFRIQNSQIMQPELAAKYPQIQSYLGQGIDAPNVTTRFDLSPNGFRAIIFSNMGTVLIEPYAKGDTSNYISFYKGNVPRNNVDFQCEFSHQNIWEGKGKDVFQTSGENVRTVTNGTTLRTYRLAMAATGEYTTFFRQAGDTDAQAVTRALAAINTTMNRVNGVYERDVAVRMILVANTDLLIYTNAATDPYSNSSGDLGANQSNIDAVIGTANYDIGHLVGTGGGGVANLNSPCSSTLKARGLTGSGNPQGDGFDIDYVAHEMGHQFGGLHTFNSTTGSCGGGNRSASAAYEPGSGITIMAYAGICGNQNLARNSIDTFHVKSLEEIVTFIGAGGNCSANTATGNTPPAIPTTSANSYNIPKQTPFSLSATTTDTNGDSITYDWQEYDLWASTTAIPNTDATGVRPIFRPYLPATTGVMNYPSLQYILNNANVPPSSYTCGASTCLTGELLPNIARTMNFQVVARDNRAGGGGINSKTVQVIVDAASGPFLVTEPNTAVNWTGGSSQTVTWEVANTTNAPVSAATVRILLSTDGGQTFPTVISNSTANDGTETITVPNVNTTTARIKVEGEGKIFFDISNANFTITSTFVPNRHFYDFDGDFKDDISVYRNGDWYLQRSTAGFLGIPFGLATDKTVAADYDGDGKADTAIHRPSSVDNQPDFYVLLTNGFVLQGVAWGTTGDLPCVADYDGDNKSDYCVWRPAQGDYFILYQNGNTQHFRFGVSTDKLVNGDFDGDNKADFAVFRSGTWYIQRSTAGFTSIAFGLATDIPVPSDFDGDGKTDVAVYRGGNWYVLGSTTGFAAYSFGLATDIPAPADYDGDNKSDITVYRPSDGTWYQLRTTSGFAAIPFGLNGDKPIPAQNQ